MCLVGYVSQLNGRRGHPFYPCTPPDPVGRYTTGQATTECNELKAQVVGGSAGHGLKCSAVAQKPIGSMGR